MTRSSAAPSHAEIARKPEPQRHGWEPAVCGPRCGLLVWPTCRWRSVMGEQPVSSQSADAGVGQQAARRSAMSRCSRRQFRRLFGAYGRAKGHHMAIVPARGWRGSCDVPVGWTEEHQCTRNPESGAPRAELLRCHGVLTSALKRGLTAGTTGHSAGPARAQRRGP